MHWAFLWLNRLLAIITLSAYVAVCIPPALFSWAGLYALLLPPLLLLNVFLLLFSLLIGSRENALLSLLVLILGVPFLRATISFDSNQNIESPSFSVLSYNVRVFNSYREHRGYKRSFSTSKKLIAWVEDDTSSIKCFQEFYTQEKSRIFNVKKRLAKKGFKAAKVHSSFTDWNEGKYGLAIFSRFPVVSSGSIVLSNEPQNTAIYADLLIGLDTIRVYNVHLESMHIDQNLLEGKRMFRYAKYLLQKVKEGQKHRSKQVDVLLADIKKCPYPLIVCGDFNETPYTYAYFSLRKYLRNTFEETGWGIGSTFNGRIPFLRIDHQFFSKGMLSMGCDTDTIPYSDHFPLRGVYTLSERSR